MPELPEVETIRRQLAGLVAGGVVTSMEVVDERWSRPATGGEIQAGMVGRRVQGMGRRGKYLIWELEGEVNLVQHLRMTGAILWEPLRSPGHVSARIGLDTEAGHRWVVIVDPRRFGTGQIVVGSEALEEYFASRLGPEPLAEGFTADHLRDLCSGRTAPIKATLLDQRRMAGVGNIYADEALFRAGVHPRQPAGSLTMAQYGLLREGLIEALNAGIAAQGATIDDFRHVDGARGAFQDQFLVHRRAGRPCPRCGGTISKMVVSGRGTYVCEHCQALSKRRPSKRRPSKRRPSKRRPSKRRPTR